MAETKIDNAINTINTQADYSIDSETTDSATGQKETRYQIINWEKWFGFYKNIPEVKTSIDAKATWTIGKGFKADEITELTLSGITGTSKDTFNSILSNMIKVYHICGDAFAEIIRDKENYLINLKPLEPKTIIIIANSKGRIIRYEQIGRVGDRIKTINTWEANEIFHLSRNKIADELHGIGLIEAVEETILARNEAIADYKKMLHRNVYPVRFWEVDTDDSSEVAKIEAKISASKKDFEDIVVPKGSVLPPINTGIAPNSTLNPLPWITMLTDKFYQETGVPQVIVGGSRGLTEAATKIEYLAFEQTVENEQLYIEEQTLLQLNLEIDLEFPASLQNELISDKGKEETMQASTPEDTAITNTGLNPGVAQ